MAQPNPTLWGLLSLVVNCSLVSLCLFSFVTRPASGDNGYEFCPSFYNNYNNESCYIILAPNWPEIFDTALDLCSSLYSGTKYKSGLLEITPSLDLIALNLPITDSTYWTGVVRHSGEYINILGADVPDHIPIEEGPGSCTMLQTWSEETDAGTVVNYKLLPSQCTQVKRPFICALYPRDETDDFNAISKRSSSDCSGLGNTLGKCASYTRDQCDLPNDRAACELRCCELDNNPDPCYAVRDMDSKCPYRASIGMCPTYKDICQKSCCDEILPSSTSTSSSTTSSSTSSSSLSTSSTTSVSTTSTATDYCSQYENDPDRSASYCLNRVLDGNCKKKYWKDQCELSCCYDYYHAETSSTSTSTTSSTTTSPFTSWSSSTTSSSTTSSSTSSSSTTSISTTSTTSSTSSTGVCTMYTDNKKQTFCDNRAANGNCKDYDDNEVKCPRTCCEYAHRPSSTTLTTTSVSCDGLHNTKNDNWCEKKYNKGLCEAPGIYHQCERTCCENGEFPSYSTSTTSTSTTSPDCSMYEDIASGCQKKAQKGKCEIPRIHNKCLQTCCAYGHEKTTASSSTTSISGSTSSSSYELCGEFTDQGNNCGRKARRGRCDDNLGDEKCAYSCCMALFEISSSTIASTTTESVDALEECDSYSDIEEIAICLNVMALSMCDTTEGRNDCEFTCCMADLALDGDKEPGDLDPDDFPECDDYEDGVHMTYEKCLEDFVLKQCGSECERTCCILWGMFTGSECYSLEDENPEWCSINCWDKCSDDPDDDDHVGMCDYICPRTHCMFCHEPFTSASSTISPHPCTDLFNEDADGDCAQKVLDDDCEADGELYDEDCNLACCVYEEDGGGAKKRSGLNGNDTIPEIAESEGGYDGTATASPGSGDNSSGPPVSRRSVPEVGCLDGNLQNNPDCDTDRVRRSVIVGNAQFCGLSFMLLLIGLMFNFIFV